MSQEIQMCGQKNPFSNPSPRDREREKRKTQLLICKNYKIGNSELQKEDKQQQKNVNFNSSLASTGKG